VQHDTTRTFGGYLDGDQRNDTNGMETDMDVAALYRTNKISEEVAAYMWAEYRISLVVGDPLTDDIRRGVSSAWSARDLPSD
jgi:hypothetical protein